mgnify:CR=1 FL=1
MKTQKEALDHCRAQGADLASFHNQQELQNVNRVLGWYVFVKSKIVTRDLGGKFNSFRANCDSSGSILCLIVNQKN